jgi:hypothetical protein
VIRRRVSARHRRRIEVAVHVLLLVAAVFWLPFGTRDAGGVSNVLPALHPLPPVPAPAAEARAAVPSDLDRRLVARPEVARRRPGFVASAPATVLAAAVGAVLATAVLSSRRRRSSSGLALGWHPHAPSRAPPVVV